MRVHVSVAFLRGLKKGSHLNKIFSKLHFITQGLTSAGIYLEIYTLCYTYSCDGSKARKWPFFSVFKFFFFK